jgi:hypothetical protein
VKAEEEMPGIELKFDPTRGHDVKKQPEELSKTCTLIMKLYR